MARFWRVAQMLAVAWVASGCAAHTSTLPGRPVVTSGMMRSLGPRPSYAFSCDPSNYISQHVITVTPHHVVWLRFFKASSLIVYYPVAGFCGSDNSFLGKDQVLLGVFRSPLSTQVNKVSTRIQVLSGWEGKPDIAVWEEAWLENWLRFPSEDAHVALVHVQP